MATRKPVIVESLFGELVLPPEGLRWTCVYTKSRTEKKLAEFARKKGISYYLPQKRKVSRYQRREVITELILFPGYIFMVLGFKEKELIAGYGYALNFLTVHNQKELLRELSAIYNVDKTKKEVKPVGWLKKGLKVEISSGSLAGTIGVVESHDKLDQLRLQINMLMQAVMITVDPSTVRILEEFEIDEE